ncbi:MAG: hypothetical protein ABIR70_03295 [Bryobacteraceae bacterium]
MTISAAWAETLSIRTDCDICTAAEAILAIDLSTAVPLKIAVNSRVTIVHPSAAGTWQAPLILDPGRNDITVEALGHVATTVVYYQRDDARSPLAATGFFGISLDSFADSEWNAYINPDQNSKIKERGIGGISFEYRLLGDPNKPRTQLWIFGKTIHGVRSAGVDCASIGVCVNFHPAKPNRTLYMIRASTSLEAILGARWELHSLQSRTATAAALYLKAQAGFVSVAGSGGGLMDVHHIALGAIAKTGRFAGSYVEAGVGKATLFPHDAFPRTKIDAYLQWPLAKRALTGFAQMTVDSNPHKGGADSVQSYFGIKFDLRSLF